MAADDWTWLMARKLTNLDVGDRALGPEPTDAYECTLYVEHHFERAPLTVPLPLTAEEAFRCASFGIEHEPLSAATSRVADYYLDPGAFVYETIDDALITDILLNPKALAPRNPHYQKNHVSAPGTVRSWFRKMRAADCVRDISFATDSWGALAAVRPHLRPWTLFDTQQVVVRETAAHYREVTAYEKFWGAPFQIGPEPGRWLGLDRSTYPAFSAEVKSAQARGLTLEDIWTFVREDDRLRWQRHGGYRITDITPPEGY
jgi:hypothetical protein